MAILLSSKAPTSAIRYGWRPDVLDGDSIISQTLTVTNGGAVITNAEAIDKEVLFGLSGGSAGEMTIISALAETSDGEELKATLYIPIRTTDNQLAYTARDIAGFALRKVVGNGADADATELDDALERLGDMMAGWAVDGADLGFKMPVAANDVIYAPDWAIGAIKANLQVRVFEHYDMPLTPQLALDAQRGLQRIKFKMLPLEREGEVYY